VGLSAAAPAIVMHHFLHAQLLLPASLPFAQTLFGLSTADYNVYDTTSQVHQVRHICHLQVKSSPAVLCCPHKHTVCAVKTCFCAGYSQIRLSWSSCASLKSRCKSKNAWCP
jgi:hypothetical protein